MSKNTNLSFLTDYITADITNGRIGINTPSPAYAFDVTGVANFSSSITAAKIITSTTLDGDPQLGVFTNASTGTSAEAVIYIKNGASTNDATFIETTGTNFTTTGGFVQDGGIVGTGTALAGGLSLMVRANADMRFYTNGHTNERMRITSAGNVVIGSTTEDASYKVRIVGGLLASNNTTNYAITLQNTSFSAGAHTLFVDAYSSSSSTNALFVRVNDGNTTAMVVKGSGNTLLGTGSDNGERLYVSGSIRATGSITANSDISLKKNLLKIENALEKVEQINGYTYELKEDDSKRHGGVIAQEIDKVFPEIVNKGNDGLMGVEYGNISALLIEAIKELSAEITILKNK